MDNCIFCDIISGKSKWYIIYENDYVCCFLDKFPINNGHILIATKKHYEEFVDVDSKSLQEVMNTPQRIVKILEKLLNTDGITVMQNNGVFKDVNHYHMHIIPRYIDDGFAWVDTGLNVEEDYFIKMQEKISKLLVD